MCTFYPRRQLLLFDALEGWAGVWTARWNRGRAVSRMGSLRLWRDGWFSHGWRRKSHALSIFSRINGHDPAHGHHDVSGHATKTGFELDEPIVQLQATGGIKADVQNNFTVAHIFARHLHAVIDRHGHIRRETVVRAPFVQSPNQVRPCGR